MTDDLREYLRKTLASMNYPVDGLDDDTPLGPAGLDLDSLSRTEVAFRIESEYGKLLSNADLRAMAAQTFGQFTALVRDVVEGAER